MAVVPVFVSSTFRDFHGERDILAGPVRERLDEIVAPLGMRVELIDLRWGVDTVGVSDDEAARKVLDVCLAEVKRAHPLFLGLVGDRIGYVPDAAHARHVANNAGVPQSQPIDGLSVTALEFGFGLLWESAPTGDHVVVLRDVVGTPPEGWADPDTAAVASFRDEVVANVSHRTDVVVSGYQCDVSPAGADLEKVRSAERSMSFEDLMVELLVEPVTRRAKKLAAEQAANGWSGSERLFRDDHDIMVGRDEMVASVVDAASTGGKVVLFGESGSGKSTVLCAAEDELRERGRVVVSSLLGASTTGASARALLEHLAEQISSWTGDEIAVPTGLDADELGRWWRDMLTETVSARGSFVIMVDALDAFLSEPERSDIWPVRGLPPGVGLVVSTTVPVHAQILENAGATRIAVDALPGRAASDAAQAWTSASGTSGRSLPSAVLDHIGSAARAPLWVRLAVDLLADLDADDFAAIADAPDQAQAIADLLTTEVRGFPAELGELVGLFLDTATERLDADSASILLGALAVSRSGLAPADLAALLPDDADAAIKVATLRRVLGGQLRESDATGRLTFSHSILRVAAETRAPANIHDRIVRVLDSDATWDTTDALDAVWHAIHATPSESAATLARAVNVRPQGVEIILMLALHRHPPGQRVIDSINAHQLRTRGISTLLAAQESWAAEQLTVRAGSVYAQHAMTLATESPPTDSEQLRNSMWASGNLGNALYAQGDLNGARTAHSHELDLARQLLAAQPGEFTSAHDVVISLARLGGVLLAIGDLTGALVAHHESLDLARRLHAAQPDTIKFIHVLMMALGNVGRTLIAAGDGTGAHSAYNEGLDLARQLQAAQPDTIDSRQALSRTLDDLGSALEVTGDLTGAHTVYRESLNLRRELCQRRPGATGCIRDVMVSLSHIGGVLLRIGDLPSAYASYQEELSLARQLHAGQPDAVRAMDVLAMSLDDVGRVLETVGDFNGAHTAYHESLDLARQLHAAQPDAIQPIRAIASSLDNVGRTLNAVGDTTGAYNAYDAGLGLARELHAARPDAIQEIKVLAISLDNIGHTLEATGDLTGARAAYDESLNLRRDLHRRSPDAIASIHDMTVSLNHLGRIQLETGDLRGARTAFHEELDLARQLHAAQPDAIESLRDLARSLDNVGRILETTGDLTGAHTTYQESLNLRGTLRQRRPDDVGLVRAITVSLDNIGRILETTGDLTGAHASYHESLNLARQLHAAQPDAIESLRDLAVSLDNVGRILETTGDLTGAHTTYHESLNLRRNLRERQPDAIWSAEALACSLANVAKTSRSRAIDVFHLNLEERPLRAEMYHARRDAQSALTWVRLDLSLGSFLTANPPDPSQVQIIAFHRQLRLEIRNLLEAIREAGVLTDDLRDELDRVRRILAEFPNPEGEQ